jgi:alpha-tubulin suppressor-like RCC1 family protein
MHVTRQTSIANAGPPCLAHAAYRVCVQALRAAVLLAWVAPAAAQVPLVGFDDVADHTDIAVRYRPQGVLLSCLKRDGSACAGTVQAAAPGGNLGSARSGTQVVTLSTANQSFRPAFDESDGYLKIRFLTPVRSVTIQARAYKPSVASSGNKPFMQAFNAANQHLVTVELPTVTGHGGDWQALSISRTAADIQYVVVSSYSGRTGSAVYGLFDDLWFDPVPLPQWMALAAGHSFSLALRTDGSLWSWGANGFGQLGQGSTATADHPVKVGMGSWRAVSGGLEHSLGIQSDGTLWAWGFNGNGQLGDGSTTQRLSPVRVGTASDWMAAQAGGDHSLGLRRDIITLADHGTVWSWGGNAWGQLGDGTQVRRLSPKVVADLLPMLAVHAGEGYSMALEGRSHYAYTWGANAMGQLGVGDTQPRLEPSKLNTSRLLGPVSTGTAHGVAVQQGLDTLSTWGLNSHGQLGTGTNAPITGPVTVPGAWLTVAAGGLHTLGVQRDGSLWAWGRNNAGQLGDGSKTDRWLPTRIGTSTRWVAVAAGFAHSLALQDDGSIWAWGSNDQAQLGTRDRVSVSMPQRVAALRVDVMGAPHGSVSPVGPLAAAYGEALQFQVQADAGHAAQVSGCGGSLAGGRYTTAPISGDCTVRAEFQALKLPNLTVASFGVPRRVVAGQTVTLTYTVTNLGDADAAASSTCLSTVRAGSRIARPASLGCRAQAGLAAGASQAATSKVQLPSRMAGGQWTVTVRADAAGKVTESEENDNTASRTLQLIAP